MDTDEPRTAIACLKRLIGIQPGNADAWLNLAVAQFQRGNYEEGIRSCEEVLSRDADNGTAMYNLALAHEHLRQYERALEWVRRAIGQDPKDGSLQRLELRLRLLKGKAAVVSAIRRVIFGPFRY